MNKPRTPAELEGLALDLLLAASRYTRAATRLPGVSYSAIAWRVLSDLTRETMRVSDLAQLQRVAQPTMTALVKRLEKEGWVRRVPDSADGRATLVQVTDAGRAALTEYRRAAAARVVPTLGALPERDRATLTEAIAIMQRIERSL